MTLQAGTRLGPHEILATLGAGGMGEVYRARDTKLNRDVALKVLLDSVVGDAERVARFTREAHVLASLNHPHIAHLYGFEAGPPTAFLVMELVEGPTLAELIKTSPCGMPLDQVLAIAKQIAEALEAAHEQGIIHRDLKPANIKVRDDGVVKVLDFGLARTLDPGPGTPDPGPTMTSPAMTQMGMILGTAAYMAPEQASGRTVDKRADIWSFGVVLWEMLSGRRLFDGETVSHTLADVLRAPVDLSQLPADTPRAIRDLLQRCLTRDVKKRLRDIGDAHHVLAEGFVDAPAAVQQMPTAKRPVFWMAGAVLMAVAAIALSVIHFREAPAAIGERQRFEIPFPNNNIPGRRAVPALSPDGRRLAFVAEDDEGKSHVWVRDQDAEARPLLGTEGAFGSPFWSPDSQFVVYLDIKVTSKPTLRKINASDGPSQVICPSPTQLVRGGFWTPAGQIVFGSAGMADQGLFEVAAGSGTAAPLTRLRADQASHGYPVLLPDGHHFLYVRVSYVAGIGGVYLGSLDHASTQEVEKKLLPDLANVAYVRSEAAGRGFVLFVREGTLFAQPFDEQRLELEGEPQSVVEHVSVADPDQFALFAAAANGKIVYQQDGYNESRQLVWRDRRGAELGRVGQPEFAQGGRLSPLGTVVAYIRNEGQISDLWLFDFDRKTPTKLTTNQSLNWSPTWSPDGNRILFASAQGGATGMYQKTVGDSRKEELVLPQAVPVDWSPDGRIVMFKNPDGDSLWALPDPRIAGERKPVVLVQTKNRQTTGKFSPNGRWVALQSNDSGRDEIVVRSLDTSANPVSLGGHTTKVSTNGGSVPRWRADGAELFYVAADRTMMSAKVTTTAPAFRADSPEPLFKMPRSWVLWDVDRTGQRFLFTLPLASSPPFKVILNWQAGLKK